jgi:GNAT superfamily N-acetyltransferase
MNISLRCEEEGSGPLCRRILAELPHWFGIPASVDDYVAVADRSPTVVASVDASDVGFLTTVTHSPYAAEIYVMGVLPTMHRHGVGRELLRYASSTLREAGVEYLQVKTLSARKADDGYEKTRAFYLSCGFRPLEEFPELWGPDNPALQMVKALHVPVGE